MNLKTTPIDENKEYSVSEANELTGMSTPRIMRRIKKGIISAKKIGWIWVIPSTEVKRLQDEMNEEDSEV